MFFSHLIFCCSSKSLSRRHSVILSQIVEKKSTKLYMLTVVITALLKRVDSFTNSLKCQQSSLGNFQLLFFRRLMADWVNYLCVKTIRGTCHP